MLRVQREVCTTILQTAWPNTKPTSKYFAQKQVQAIVQVYLGIDAFKGTNMYRDKHTLCLPHEYKSLPVWNFILFEVQKNAKANTVTSS